MDPLEVALLEPDRIGDPSEGGFVIALVDVDPQKPGLAEALGEVIV